jgi:predicted restriction endonuclease
MKAYHFRRSKQVSEQVDDQRTSEAYKSWRRQVLARDGYKCVRCGETLSLRAHHITKFGNSKKLRYEVDNGITLCPRCHYEEHYGPGDGAIAAPLAVNDVAENEALSSSLEPSSLEPSTKELSTKEEKEDL